MAAFSEAFFSNGTVLGRCANSIKYVSDPEAKARRIVNVSQRADISFCKAFWLLNESGKIFGMNFNYKFSLATFFYSLKK